ncbi:MAG: hypothetical protein ACE5F7_09760 [Nitrospiria bacterium]
MRTLKNGQGKIDDLAELMAGLFPRLDAEEKGLALALYRLLAEGEAVSAKRLASALSPSPSGRSKTGSKDGPAFI